MTPDRRLQAILQNRLVHHIVRIEARNRLAAPIHLEDRLPLAVEPAVAADRERIREKRTILSQLLQESNDLVIDVTGARQAVRRGVFLDDGDLPPLPEQESGRHHAGWAQPHHDHVAFDPLRHGPDLS